MSVSQKVREEAAQFVCSLYPAREQLFAELIDQVLVSMQQAYN